MKYITTFAAILMSGVAYAGSNSAQISVSATVLPMKRQCVMEVDIKSGEHATPDCSGHAMIPKEGFKQVSFETFADNVTGAESLPNFNVEKDPISGIAVVNVAY